MTAVLSSLWYIFVVAAWCIIAWIKLYNGPEVGYLAVVIGGLIFYSTKLRHINNLRLGDINTRTLLYYLFFYICFWSVGSLVWSVTYIALDQLSPFFFKKIFPTMPAFLSIANRMMLTAAAISVVIWISAGMHRHYHTLKFTNKVSLIEIIFILVTILWTCINLIYIGMFVSAVSIFTMPDHLRRLVNIVTNYIWHRPIIPPLSNGAENNSDTDPLIQTREDFLFDIWESIKSIVIIGCRIHFYCAVVAIGLGVALIPIRH